MNGAGTFEYKVRDYLYGIGALFIVRAAGSRTPADLVVFWEPVPGFALEQPHVWLVQAKKDGKLPKAEREKLCKLALELAAVPALAVECKCCKPRKITVTPL